MPHLIQSQLAESGTLSQGQRILESLASVIYSVGQSINQPINHAAGDSP